jgi:hypothetical protein
MRSLIKVLQKKGAQGIEKLGHSAVFHLRLIFWAGAAPNVALIIWLIAPPELTASNGPLRSSVKN